MKKYLSALFLTAFFLIASNNTAKAFDSDILFFWDKGCQYCEKSKDEILEKGLGEKISIQYIEVSANQENKDLFFKYIKQCGIKKPSIPMLVVDDRCFSGYPTVIEIIEKNISGEELPIEQKSSNNLVVNNTLVLLLIIPAFCLLLVGYGYISNRSTKKVFVATAISSLLLTALPTSSYAICPLCTVAVGAGLGLSRYLGIDDEITGIWAGGIVMSFTIILAEKIITKFKRSSLLSSFLSFIVMYSLTVLPLYIFKVIGGEVYILGMDRVGFGIFGGSLLFLGAAILNNKIKSKFGRVLFPYQKVVLPVMSLWIGSLILYIINN